MELSYLTPEQAVPTKVNNRESNTYADFESVVALAPIAHDADRADKVAGLLPWKMLLCAEGEVICSISFAARLRAGCTL